MRLGVTVAQKLACAIYLQAKRCYFVPARREFGMWIHYGVRQTPASLIKSGAGEMVMSCLQRATLILYSQMSGRLVDAYYRVDRQSVSHGARIIAVESIGNGIRVVPYRGRKTRFGPELEAVPDRAQTCFADDIGALDRALRMVARRAPKFIPERFIEKRSIRFAEIACFDDRILVSSYRHADDTARVHHGHLIRLPEETEDNEIARALSTALRKPTKDRPSADYLRAAGLQRWTQFRPNALVHVQLEKGRLSFHAFHKEGGGHAGVPGKPIVAKSRKLADLASAISRAIKRSADNMHVIFQ